MRKETINPQVLNLGIQETARRVEGTTMTETEIAGVPFQSQRLDKRIEQLEQEAFSRRLWQKDAGLWKRDEPEQQRTILQSLGWLDVPEAMQKKVGEIQAFVKEIKEAGFTHVVHMGMGGSSLAPLVFQQLFRPGPDGLPLIVLDTTDPFTVATLDQRVDIASTLFIVASKSGTTAEPLAFCDYFYDRVRAVKGQDAGENFVAITDPGSPLVTAGQQRGFRRTFDNFPDIGGRYSALSYFGLLPAALMGLDVNRLIVNALKMRAACGAGVEVRENPGIMLGATMGEMARAGRDKVTFLMPDNLAALGMWLEQLIAESTGKEGTGLLPVADEPAGPPLVYGNDRLFVYMFIRGAVDQELADRVAVLQRADLPVVTIELREAYDVTEEFFRWEVATACAGAVLGINPFDQPNVQESKDVTNAILGDAGRGVQGREDQPAAVDGPLRFFGTGPAGDARLLLWDFLSEGGAGEYVCLQAYLPETPATDRLLRSIRLLVRDNLRAATTSGYGPRFLHSTGQFHKGGPNTGLFIQLTAKDPIDLAIPGRPYTFGAFKHAQARGDLEALTRHGRRTMRIDLGDNVGKGLEHLRALVAEALSKGAGG